MKYIYGLNKSGLSIALFFLKKNIPFLAWDDDEIKRKRIKSLYDKIKFKKPENLNYHKLKESYITPGIDLRSDKLKSLKDNKIKMFRDLELYSNLITDQKIIGITGTNGKSTTTKLIGDMIKKNKKNCFVGGNIGVPLIDFYKLKKNAKIHVVELSSFQLESAPSYKSHISILLNISNDHQDRYKNFNAYIKEKKKIISKNSAYNIICIDDHHCQKIINSLDSSLKYIAISSRKKISNGIYISNNKIIDNYFHKNKIININKLSKSLVGTFNYQNIVAAYTVSAILNIKKNLFLSVLENFKGLPHRMERIYEDKNVLVINNSKSTNLNSAINSIKNFNNLYLIFGGKIKDKNYLLLNNFKKNIKKCYIIGHHADFIFKQIKNSINAKLSNNIENAVEEVFKDLNNINKKKVILFSPGCSSFDQFKNFEERGNLFKKEIFKQIKKN